MTNLERELNQMQALEDGLAIATRRADIFSTKAGKDAAAAMMKELQSRLNDLRQLYLGIDTNRHPNAIIADLARLQGEERQVRDMLFAWETAEAAKKELAESLLECQSRVTLMKERMQ